MQAQPSIFEMFLPLVFIFVIFYFLIIRPQSKKIKEQEKMISELKRGDDVVTTSGILGRIEGLTEMVATLEISEGTRIKVLRKQIAGLQSGILNSSNEKKS